MNFISGKKLCAFVFVVVSVFLGGVACQKAQAPAANQSVEAVRASSPTEAYKMLYAAVKAKDTTRIRQLLSKNSMALAGMGATQFNHTIEKQIENGMLETTFADALPQLRDERVRDNFGAVEVFNQKSNRWDDTTFILEDGGWKLAVGDQMNGTYKSPGKGQAEIEAASPAGNNMTPLATNTNGKFPLSNAGGGKVKTAEVPLEKESKKPADKQK